MIVDPEDYEAYGMFDELEEDQLEFSRRLHDIELAEQADREEQELSDRAAAKMQKR